MERQATKQTKFNERPWIGAILLLIGAILAVKQIWGHVFPGWLFSWEVILIIVGLAIGSKSGFRDFSWFIMILVGAIFLSDDIYPEINLKKYAVPIIISTVGLIFLLAPKHKGCNRPFGRRRQHPDQVLSDSSAAAVPVEDVTSVDNTQEAVLDIVSIFSGIKRKVLSKQFRGGDIVCVFGGSEVNLSNADFSTTAVLELVQIFGGTKLVVPANWEILSEVASIFGGVDDRRVQPPNTAPEKTIILRGTIIFGGVEINSF